MSGGIHWAIMCFFLSLTVKSSSLTNANIFLFSHNGPRNAECACACVRQFTIPSSIFAGHKTQLSQKWKQNKQTLKSVALFNFNKLSCFVCCAVSHLGNCLCIIGPNVYSCRLWYTQCIRIYVPRCLWCAIYLCALQLMICTQDTNKYE